jgi:hypothetical protein
VEDNQARMYEPPILTYHRVVNHPFNMLHFKFSDPDGTTRHFKTPNAEHGVQISLSFRRIKNKDTDA